MGNGGKPERKQRSAKAYRADNDLPVTRRFIERWAPVSISVNTAVSFRYFAVMELVGSDREPERLVTPCGRPCGDLCLRLGKVDKNKTDRKPFGPFGAIWRKLSDEEKGDKPWRNIFL